MPDLVLSLHMSGNSSTQLNMSRHFSLRRLLFLFFVLLVVAVHAQEEYEETGITEEVDIDAADEIVEATEPVAEDPVPEPEPEPEPVPAPEPEPVSPTPDVNQTPQKASLPKIKLPEFSQKISEVVGKVKDQSKKAFDKVKSISQKDAKKVAAAVVGVWGVSVGVGWLAQNAKPAAPIPTNGKKGKK